MMEMNEEVMIMEEDARELNETETYDYDSSIWYVNRYRYYSKHIY